MKNKLITFLIVMSILCAMNACEKDQFLEYHANITQQFAYPPMFSAQNNYIVDLMLIYQGTDHEINYSQEHFIPYVYSEKLGQFDWLFDGFLVYEIRTNSPRRMGTDANKSDWEWMMQKQILTKGVGIQALNSLLDSLKTEGKVPERKRKVVIGIPSPSSEDIDWGEIDGKEMNMTTDVDKIKTVKWYIDEVLKRWISANLTELEFSGFYWVHEGETQHTTDRYILPSISQYIKDKGLCFYWIPYFGAHMGADWKKWGFDIAYEQPNYFFRNLDKEWLPSRLDDACYFASKYNMGLEMEFDQEIFQSEIFHRRFEEYIEYFRNNKVWETAPVAHYDNRGTHYEMFHSVDVNIKKLHDMYVNEIVKRQNRADSIYRKITN